MPVIRKIEDAPKVPFKLDGRIMFSSPWTEVIHLTLKPGEMMDPHTQPFDVVFYVLEGTGILRAGEEKIEASADTSIWVEEGTERCWTNQGEKSLRILVIKELV